MKIGLLAMSGIRAHDPELLELGLTLPGFVERSKQVASLPSLGLLYLAAVTPGGHELSYYEAEGDGSEPAELYDCDLVAISTFSAQIFEAYAIADRLRARGVSVAMGGLHVSAEPEEAAEHADYVAIGEGERIWPEIIALEEVALEEVALEKAALEEEALEGAVHAPRTLNARDFEPVDVRALPVPRYDLLGERPYNRYTVQTSRGCPWRCEFCASTVMLSETYRKRSVADVVRDIRAIQRVAPGAFIEFADDNTFVDKQWGKQLCRALIPLGIKWFTETDISVGDDPELLELMARSGCRQVLIGLEAPRQGGLAGLELRTDFKSKRFEGYARAIERIQASGVTVNGCFILGLDGHGPEVFDEVFEFAERTSLFEVQVTYLTAFPGTPLLERFTKEERVIEPGRWELCTLFDVNYEPRGMSVDELRAGMHALSKSLYTAEALKRRRAPFFANLRAGLRRSERVAS
jgi:radical SAM superfamily enzyme YgiQ (UPF0313 family)